MSKKILIVDDEPDILKIIAMRLSKMGCELIIANNGQEAIDLARERKPDLILMDYHMPVMDGLEVGKKIREDNQLKHIPLIFMTATPADVKEDVLKTIKVDAYIKKPFEATELIDQVQRFIGQGEIPEHQNVKEKPMSGKILIIEDDKDLAMVLAMRLTKSGFEVKSCPDATLGVKEAHQFKPHLIILDLMLPAGGGFAVLERVKLSTNTNQIPIFILTGSGDDKAKEKAMRMGAQQFIAKPYEFDVLLEEIKKVIE